MVKINELSLKFGSSQGKELLKFPVTLITVFVGPNNSGKSWLIRELSTFFKEGKNLNNKILENITYEALDEKEIYDYFNNGEIEFVKANSKGHYNILRYGNEIYSYWYNKDNLKSIFRNPNLENNLENFARTYISYRVLLLDGSNRLNLLNSQGGYDLKAGYPQGTLQKLHYSNERRGKYRKLVYQGLGVYPVIDTLNMGSIQSGVAVNIVSLTYQRKEATARLLKSEVGAFNA